MKLSFENWVLHSQVFTVYAWSSEASKCYKNLVCLLRREATCKTAICRFENDGRVHSMWHDNKGREQKKITRAQRHKSKRSLAQRATQTQVHRASYASERSLMLMCSERQRWCMRWSVERLWIRLCCRVSSSRQTLLSRLCVGVSQGDMRAFPLWNLELRPAAAAAAFQFFMTHKGPN